MLVRCSSRGRKRNGLTFGIVNCCCVRDAEAASSSLATPTKKNRLLTLIFGAFRAVFHLLSSIFHHYCLRFRDKCSSICSSRMYVQPSPPQKQAGQKPGFLCCPTPHPTQSPHIKAARVRGLRFFAKAAIVQLTELPEPHSGLGGRG